MKKVDDEEIKLLINKLKEKHGSNIHYMLFIYNSEDGNKIKFTQNLETSAPDVVISFLERSKSMIVQSLNKDLGDVLKKKKDK